MIQKSPDVDDLYECCSVSGWTLQKTPKEETKEMRFVEDRLVLIRISGLDVWGNSKAPLFLSTDMFSFPEENVSRNLSLLNNK